MGILFGEGATYVGGLALAAATGRLPGGFPEAPDELEAADPPGKRAAAWQLPFCLEDVAALVSGTSLSLKKANPGEVTADDR